MSVNKVMILGNLGQDPELRSTSNGTPVCTFSIATTEVRNDREGNRQENTEWHKIVVWSKQAQNCAKYLSKGRTVFVEGRLQTRSWDDKQTGQKRYATEIVANNVQFVGGASSGPRQDSYGQNNSYDQRPPSTPSYNDQGGMPPASDFGAPSTPNLDDIPF